jgi:hypothetical protein
MDPQARSLPRSRSWWSRTPRPTRRYLRLLGDPRRPLTGFRHTRRRCTLQAARTTTRMGRLADQFAPAGLREMTRMCAGRGPLCSVCAQKDSWGLGVGVIGAHISLPWVQGDGGCASSQADHGKAVAIGKEGAAYATEPHGSGKVC